MAAIRAIYVAGPYGAPTEEGISANVLRASSEAATLLYQDGYAVFCPHSMSHGWERALGYTWERTLAACCEWVLRCDAILMLPGWQASPGSLMERRCAHAARIPVFYRREDLLSAMPPDGTD